MWEPSESMQVAVFVVSVPLSESVQLLFVWVHLPFMHAVPAGHVSIAEAHNPLFLHSISIIVLLPMQASVFVSLLSVHVPES